MKKFKKISYLFVVMFGLFLAVSPVLAVDVKCKLGNKTISFDPKLPDTIHVIILVLQIAVPVLLVIFGSIDFVKALTSQKDDEIKKGQKTFISRLIAGAIIFFVVAIVKLIVSFAAGDDANDILNCADCFLSGKDSGGCMVARGLKKS